MNEKNVTYSVYQKALLLLCQCVFYLVTTFDEPIDNFTISANPKTFIRNKKKSIWLCTLLIHTTYYFLSRWWCTATQCVKPSWTKTFLNELRFPAFWNYVISTFKWNTLFFMSMWYSKRYNRYEVLLIK